MINTAPFQNRLKKNWRHLSKWARRRGVSCFRIYDRDIPEFPYALDWYEGRVHIQTFASARDKDPSEPDYANQLKTLIAQLLDIPDSAIFFKTRERQQGSSQYQKQADRSDSFIVHEEGLQFLVNMEAYLDTGLFLDHRQTRQMVLEKASGRRFLNLFAYTSSFSVYAAAGGADTTISVDLSKTYQQWSKQNFLLNGMDPNRHQLEQMDVFSYLKRSVSRKEKFDLIVMDPPSFSNSKRMSGVLDVQRDHPLLIRQCLKLLAPGGELIFSNNFRRFKLDPEIADEANCIDISSQTVSEDFKRHKPHHCWHITHQK